MRKKNFFSFALLPVTDKTYLFALEEHQSNTNALWRVEDSCSSKSLQECVSLLVGQGQSLS